MRQHTVKWLAGVAGFALLAGCAPGDVQVMTDADTNVRVTYTAAQEQAYRDYMWTNRDRMIPDEQKAYMSWDGVSEPSAADWEPYVIRAKALCDDARTRGWAAATLTFKEQSFREAVAALPADTPADQRDVTMAEMEPMMMPLINLQVDAVTAPGSLCPDIS